MKVYADLGIDPNKAVEAALQVPISMHCWQADDVAGLESGGSAADSGGIKSTGNYPGKARNGDEMRMDFEKVLSLLNHVQYAFNTMVNATSHHSHPRSIHSQSIVNPQSTPQQWQNNAVTIHANSVTIHKQR